MSPATRVCQRVDCLKDSSPESRDVQYPSCQAHHHPPTSGHREPWNSITSSCCNLRVRSRFSHLPRNPENKKAMVNMLKLESVGSWNSSSNMDHVLAYRRSSLATLGFPDPIAVALSTSHVLALPCNGTQDGATTGAAESRGLATKFVPLFRISRLIFHCLFQTIMMGKK